MDQEMRYVQFDLEQQQGRVQELQEEVDQLRAELEMAQEDLEMMRIKMEKLTTRVVVMDQPEDLPLMLSELERVFDGTWTLGEEIHLRDVLIKVNRAAPFYEGNRAEARERILRLRVDIAVEAEFTVDAAALNVLPALAERAAHLLAQPPFHPEHNGVVPVLHQQF